MSSIGTTSGATAVVAVRRSIALAIMSAVIWVLAPFGQASSQQVPSAARTITAITDTLTNPTSRGGQMLSGLARELGTAGDLRVLVLAGRGGADDLRDLLYLRGVDFAVLNADVLASLGGTKIGERASSELRYVTKLFGQRVLLIARPSVASIADLSGKVVAVRAGRPDARMTAETLFKLSGVPVKIETLPQGPETRVTHDALLLLESEFPEVGELVGHLDGYRLVPIAFDRRLAAAYRPAELVGSELPHLAGGAPVSTISVDTVLAVYNWRSGAKRRKEVVALIAALYARLPALRQGADGGLWRQVDIGAEVAGWTRYPFAEPSRYLEPGALAELRQTSPVGFFAPASAATIAAAPKSATAKAGPPPLSVLAFERPPFSSQNLPGGGPALELLRAGLARQGNKQSLAVEWVTLLGDEPLVRLIDSNRFDVMLPWPYFPCDQPSQLTGPTALICDNAQFSKPLFTDILQLVLPLGSTINLDAPDTLAKRRICITDPGHVKVVMATSGDWERRYAMEFVKRLSVVECLGAVQRSEADGILASEAESNHALDVLGIRKLFAPAGLPVGIQSWTAVVPKDRPSSLLDVINGSADIARGAAVGDKSKDNEWRDLTANARPK